MVLRLAVRFVAGRFVAVRFLAAFFFAPPADFFRDTAMLSTRLGYSRPALRARPRASAFCAAVSLRAPLASVVFFRGLDRSHGT